ncbi:NACHT domain-containing protein [Nocardiopsis sp. NPDC058631]|uniref:NACHT domain-containing protein n=1 Tax=Nocardiopsis sp. NPDC058631 TaxID=3346566 RepID=UPI003654735F
MAKRLTYADALKVLGKNDSDLLDFAERLADGGLELVGIPDLFGARSFLVGKGRQAVEGIRDKLSGESRMSRTEKVAAAHRVLLVVSFLEAAEESWGPASMPFPLEDLELASEGQLDLFQGELSAAEPPGPPTSAHLQDTVGSAPGDTLYLGASQAFAAMVAGTAQAAEHEIASVDHPSLALLSQELPRRAHERYRENYRRLAAEIPEFGMWAHLEAHEVTRRSLDTGLGELHRQLSAIASRRGVDVRRRELTASYRSVLRQPVLRSEETARGLVLPPLEDAYIPPRGRIARILGGGSPSMEEWWQHQTLFDDLQGFMAAHLVHVNSISAPTVVLGHPGAGKSKFTEMLAARLPESDFLPIRVELRSVQPNSPIHLQIEEGLAATLHTRVSWRELAESADGALPVIILDGFDELLQATGVDRSDYLERVQEFQHQQDALGQPVVVIVTSRTVVADRARFPDDTVVIRLEPFDEPRIGQMLEVWNRANERSLTASGLAPLTIAALERYRELAEQPLLLLMLLMYDAGDNALRRADDALRHGELYERLLTMFARREVEKHRSGLSRSDFDTAVEDELRRLEVAALAMFTRRKQTVAADELEQDLEVLMPDAAVRPEDAGLHGHIAPAHQVLGRFFFVHESQARVGGGAASVFEFLHATFGEYLVARAVVAALADLDDARSRSSRRRGRSVRPDDGELFALSSFASYAGRDKVVDFLSELLEHRFSEEPEAREDYAALLVELFQEAPFPASNRSYTEYEPARLPFTRREANYTSNLMILLVLVREEPVDARELFPGAEEPDQALQGTSALWRTLPGSEWFSIMSTIRVRHLDGWAEGGQVTVLGREDGSPVDVGECIGFELTRQGRSTPVLAEPYGVTVPYDSVTSRLLRSMAMRVNGTAARFTIGLVPFLRHVSEDLGTWYQDPKGDRVWSELHEVQRLRMEPAQLHPHQRLDTYRRLLSQTSLGRLELITLTQAAEDLASESAAPFPNVMSQHLGTLVRRYFARLRDVVPGPRLSEALVMPVLSSLPDDVVTAQVAEHVRGLLRANREAGAEPPGEATDSVPALRQVEAATRPYGSAGPEL